MVTRYRSITPKARLIPLTQSFVDYLRADGIILPPEAEADHQWSDTDSGIFSANDDGSDDGDEDVDPSAQWREVQQAILSTIAELDGKVVPKLNWSAPKDATWINATNSMECRTPNDIYLLLKSSDFVAHDLEHAFDGCVEEMPSMSNGSPNLEHPDQPAITTSAIPYHLVLRKHIMVNPAVEFRCFVRRRKLVGICQRDLNHFDFLFQMVDSLRERIQDFFDQKLRGTFPDENFAFDVYIPPPHKRVWLVDVNPWAPRTDPLLFSWLELLTMPEPPPLENNNLNEDFVRLSVKTPTTPIPTGESDTSDTDDEVETEMFQPEFRLVKKDDPEAHSFNTPQFSAHKLPLDVVGASQNGPGPMREFANQWKEMMVHRERESADSSEE